MPSWLDVLNEINAPQTHSIDAVRRKWMHKLYEQTGRNVIAYYSGFLNRNEFGVAINDMDINGFMAVIHGLDRSLHQSGKPLLKSTTQHLLPNVGLHARDLLQ